MCKNGGMLRGCGFRMVVLSSEGVVRTLFSGSYFSHLLRGSLGWLLLVGSLFLLVQCGGGSNSGEGGSGGGAVPFPPLLSLPPSPVSSDDCEPEADDATGLTIVGTKLSSKRAEIGDNLRVTVTVRNQGTATSGGAGSPQTVTFYSSNNKFISPRDEVLGTASLDALEPNAESDPSFSFLALAGDNYYGACLGTTNNCQVGVKVSVPSPDISGSNNYSVFCQLYRANGSTFMVSRSVSPMPMYTGHNFTENVTVNQGQEKHYLLEVGQKGPLDIWSTGSQDTVALLFYGNCNSINGHHYAEDGGIGGGTNFQIGAIAEAGYYFLVIHEKSLGAATFDVKIRLNSAPEVKGSDPLYPQQWHLNNPDDQEIDINAPQAWEITRGCPSVLVAVIDTGVEITHPDLAPNHDDRYNFDTYGNGHGTLVAGLIAAKGNNGIGVSGVAPEVSFVSRHAVGSGKTQTVAEAFLRDKEQVAISNNSWSNPSRGRFDPKNKVFRTAIEDGVTNGYGGKGIFYTFAGGNNHKYGSNSGYHSLGRYYSVATICAVNKNGERSSYSDKGANLWVCAPSGLTTTDIVGIGGYDSAGGDYVHNIVGTSAAAPIVSGVAALMRSINPELGWRDIRLILAVTAQKNDSPNPGWFQGVASYDDSNYSGSLYQHNHEYGFGLVNAEAAVLKSQSWNNVGDMVKSSSQSKDIPQNEQRVPDGDGLSSVISVTDLNDTLDFIEYVDIDIKISGEHYGNLQINLTSPANKTSILAEQHDCYKLEEVVPECFFSVPTKASFGSARHLGESPDGDWTLKVIDEVTGDNNNVYSWKIKFYGHKKP